MPPSTQGPNFTAAIILVDNQQQYDKCNKMDRLTCKTRMNYCHEPDVDTYD